MDRASGKRRIDSRGAARSWARTGASGLALASSLLAALSGGCVAPNDYDRFRVRDGADAGSGIDAGGRIDARIELDAWSEPDTGPPERCTGPSECDDRDACTADSCDRGSCTSALIPGCCDEAADCADASACTTDSCDIMTQRCVHTPVAQCCSGPEECADASPCTDERCEAGICANPIDDTNTCPGGTCHGGACCIGCWDGVSCRPGNEAAACGASGGACVTCVDANPCTDDLCGGAVCSHLVVSGRACDDGRTDTCVDQCGIDGVCRGSPVYCEDLNPCTNEAPGCGFPGGCARWNVDDGTECGAGAVPRGRCCAGNCVDFGNCCNEGSCGFGGRCAAACSSFNCCGACGGGPGSCSA